MWWTRILLFFLPISPVDLRFDLEQIATETNSSKIVSIGLQKQHIKNSASFCLSEISSSSASSSFCAGDTVLAFTSSLFCCLNLPISKSNLSLTSLWFNVNLTAATRFRFWAQILGLSLLQFLILWNSSAKISLHVVRCCPLHWPV